MGADYPLLVVAVAITSLAGVAIVAMALLSGWRGWLALKRAELDRMAGAGTAGADRLPAADRIEMADLRERIRKLEAIAAGVDP